MAWARDTIKHPTFGNCVRIPSLMAVRWAGPASAQAAALAAVSAPVVASIGRRPTDVAGRKRDPRHIHANNSEALSFADATKITDARVDKLKGDPNVAWIAPVYRAASSENKPEAYFTVDPGVILLTAAAAQALGGAAALGEGASVDQKRSALIKGYVVVNLPQQNALDVAQTAAERLAGLGIADGVIVENIPYMSPLCGCACGQDHKRGAKRCIPPIETLIPNDTYFASQWGLQRINAPRAWPLSEGDPSVVIAVLDQGVDLAHPDLNLTPLSYSTITHTNNGAPVGPHGTCCAGIISAKIGNGSGVSGLAGKCRVLAISTYFTDVQVAEGLYFAADNGARVVSMSFGVYPSWNMWNFAIIQAALQYCQDKNVVLVAASGNEDIATARFPGSDPRTICVGGSNRADERKRIGDTSSESWWGACYGPDLDVVGPCLEIPTTDQLGVAGYTTSDYDMTFNGTSAATPHVAGLAGLLLSVAPGLSHVEVRKIISETTDKINAGTYVYATTPGKPYGTWTSEVGYGRINIERALLCACAHDACCGKASCTEPEECCVSPCDPPWLPDSQCMSWPEQRVLRVALTTDPRLLQLEPQAAVAAAPARAKTAAASRLTLPSIGEATAELNLIRRIPYGNVEFRITYDHKLCLVGKQHGPLVYTVTLLPGEKVNLYHSDRYRNITSTQDRYSVRTTFSQFLSVVHAASVSGNQSILSDVLTTSSKGGSVSAGVGFLFGLFGGGAGTSTSSGSTTTDHTVVQVNAASSQFEQSVQQASLLTEAERSVVVSTYEDKEVADITVRVIANDNACRAVTYFVRKVMEAYTVGTEVHDVAYRIVAPNVSPDWHDIGDLDWLSADIRNQVAAAAKLLPRAGDKAGKPTPVTIPTDGTVYDAELAHCCSCEPERAAAIEITLDKQRADARKASLEAELLEIEVQRRKLLLQRGALSPFETAAPAPLP